MRTVKFTFWVKVGVSAGLFALAVLLLVSEGWREALFGFDPRGSILGPVVAVLMQGAVLAAVLAAANWRGAGASQEGQQPLPFTPRRRAEGQAPRDLPMSMCVGAFEVAASGARE